MTPEQKKQLFPFFAYLYSKKLNPERYGEIESFDEWSKVLSENDNDRNQIINAAVKLSDEEWENLQNQYDSYAAVETGEDKSEEDIMIAKKGAYLKKLKSKKSSIKKCKCGCDLIDVKEDGGKITKKCSCNCSGGKIK